MKKQIVQTLWRIANGQPQEQGEKIVYPNIREQLNAMKAIMSIKGWDELDFQEVSSSPASSSESSIISEEITANCQQTTITNRKRNSYRSCSNCCTRTALITTIYTTALH